MKPRFFICSDVMRNVWNDYGIFFSEKFCCYFADNVERIIKRDTGLVASSRISLSAFRQNNDLPMYEKGEVSVIRTAISILPEFIDNINFYWKSKTGKIITTTDEDFDTEDLECWIEGLKPALYWEQVSSTVHNHPFQKDLPFKLIVHNFGTLMKLTIEVGNVNIAEIITGSLSKVIEQHNKKSEAQNRENGVIHSYHSQEKNGNIVFSIDLGSAGVPFIKKLLKKLSEFSEVQQVELDL